MPKVIAREFGIKDMKLLPPHPDCCQECAARHEWWMPHNQESLFYQYKFFQEHDRWPTWTDALAHCPDDVKEAWIEALRQRGIEVES